MKKIEFETFSDAEAWERHITDVGLSSREPSERGASESASWLYGEVARAMAERRQGIPFPGELSAVWLEQVRCDVEQRLEDPHGVLGIGGQFTTRDVVPPQSWYWALAMEADVTVSCTGMLYLELPPASRPFAHWKLTRVMNAIKAHERQREATVRSARIVEETPHGIVLYSLPPAMNNALRAAMNLPPPAQRRFRGAPRALSDDKYIADLKKYPGSSDSRRAQRLGVSRATIHRMKKRLKLPTGLTHLHSPEPGAPSVTAKSGSARPA